MMRLTWLLPLLLLFGTLSASAQNTPTVETTTALTCAAYSPLTVTAVYASGAYVHLILQNGGVATVQAKLGDDTMLTAVTGVSVNWTGQWDAPYYQHFTVQVPAFSVTLNDGTVLSIGPTFYVATRSGHSGRGGGNVYAIQSGDQTISYSN